MLTLDVALIPYDRTPGFGPDHLLARLQRGDLTDAFPAFTADHPHQPLASEFLNRAALADKLVATNAAYGNPLPDSTVAAIRSDGIFIIAGQQPGLLLGPMYTLLKAISALALARQLRDRVNVPVIPAFWIASEDHDLAEVNHVTITGRRFTCQHDQLKSPGPLPPVANISLTQFKPDLIAFLEQQLPNRPHKPWVLDQIKSIAFDNYPTMFAQLLTRVLGDEQIVLIDPMAMRELTAPVIAAALDRHEAIQSAFDTGRQQLAAAGFTPPLERVAVFEMTDQARLACAWAPDGLVTAAGKIPYDQAADLVRTQPHRYSPNAALRPILQDAVLPTLATIAGPSEAQYLWQIDPLYDALNVTRSRIAPRISATFIDTDTANRAQRLGYDPPSLFDSVSGDEAYDSKQTTADAGDLHRISGLGRDLLDAVDSAATRRHHQLVARAHRSIRHHVERLVAHLHDERLAEHGLGRAPRRRLLDVILPTARPQERVTNPAECLARFGPKFVPSMLNSIDPTAHCHHLVHVHDESQ